MAHDSATATTFIVQLLRQYPENELQVADFVSESNEKFSTDNITQGLQALLRKGWVSQEVEADGSVWWAISAAGIRGDVPAPKAITPDPGLVRAKTVTVEIVPASPPSALRATRPIAATAKAGPRSHLVQDGLSALAGPKPPPIGDLFDLIHRINPTGREVATDVRSERYQLKHRLQSLLIRHYPNDIVVQADSASAEVVGLAHARQARDACHAVVSDLDEDARSWVRFTLDTRETTAKLPTTQPAATTRQTQPQVPQDTVEGYLARAEVMVAEYQYDEAEATLRLAFLQSGGSVGTAVPLLELLVDTLANYPSALACRADLDRRARIHPAVQVLLAVAAVQSGDSTLAAELLPDSGGPRVAETWALIAQQEVRSGQIDAAKIAARRAREAGAPTPVLVEVEAQIAQLLAALRQPQEARLQALADSGDHAEALGLARQLLAERVDSPLARRLVREADQRAGEAERAAAEAQLRAQERARAERDSQLVTDVVSSLDAGERRVAWRAWSKLPEPLQAKIERDRPSPVWTWLRVLVQAKLTLAHAEEAVEVALDLYGRQPMQHELAELCHAHPVLRHVPVFRQAVAAHEAAQAAAVRKEAETVLEEAAGLLLADDLAGASAALNRIPNVAGTLAAEHKRLGDAVALRRQVLAESAGLASAIAAAQWGEAQERAWALLRMGGRQDEMECWQGQLATAQAAMAKRWPNWLDKPGTGRKPVIPLEGHGDFIYAAANAMAGRATVVVLRGGWLFLEVTDLATAQVVSRGVIALGLTEKMVERYEDGKVLLALHNGSLLTLDPAEARIVRARTLPVSAGEVVTGMFGPDNDHLWLGKLHLDRNKASASILSTKDFRPVWKAKHAGIVSYPIAGLQPPGWFDGHPSTSGAVWTSRGQAHPVELMGESWRTVAVSVSPYDPRRIVTLVQDAVPGSNQVSYLIFNKGPGLRMYARLPLPGVKPLCLATSRSARLVYLLLLDEAKQTTRLAAYQLAELGPKVVFDVPTAHASTLVQDPLANELYLWREVDGEVEVHHLGTKPPPPVAAGPTDSRRLMAQVKRIRLSLGKPVLGDKTEVLFRTGRLDPAHAVAALEQAEYSMDRLALLQRLTEADDKASILAVEQALPAGDRTDEHYCFHRAGQALEQGDFAAMAAALETETPLHGSSEQHRQHMLAVAALQQGDTPACRKHLQAAAAAFPNLTVCCCEVGGLIQLADAAERVAAGQTVTWLDSELAAIRQADIALAAQDPAAALVALEQVPLLRHPQAQTLARAVTATLALPADDHHLFRTGLLLATFLDCLIRPQVGWNDTLIVPGAHWSRTKLEALAAQATAWLETRLVKPGDGGF